MASALRRLSFDYAIVGAGASGMAFLDTLLVSHPRRGTDLRVALVKQTLELFLQRLFKVPTFFVRQFSSL